MGTRRTRFRVFLDEQFTSAALVLLLLGFIASMLSSRALRGFVDTSGSPYGPLADALVVCGGNAGWLVAQGQVWRFVSACFLHANLVHIAVNCWALVQCGSLLKTVLNGWQQTSLWLLSGVLGSLASFLWHVGPWLSRIASGDESWASLAASPEARHSSIGASGAVFGIIGFLIGYLWKADAGQGAAIRNQLVFWVIINIGLGLSVPNIDNAAHFGGGACGWAFGRLLVARRFRGVSRVIRSDGLGMACGGVICVGLAWAAVDYSVGTGREYRRSLPMMRPVAAVIAFEHERRTWRGHDGKPERLRALRDIEDTLPRNADDAVAARVETVRRYIAALRTEIDQELPGSAAAGAAQREFQELVLAMSRVLGRRFPNGLRELDD